MSNSNIAEVLERNGLDLDTSLRGVYRLRESQMCCSRREDCQHFGGNARRVLETVARMLDDAGRLRRLGHKMEWERMVDDARAILAEVLR